MIGQEALLLLSLVLSSAAVEPAAVDAALRASCEYGMAHGLRLEEPLDLPVLNLVERPLPMDAPVILIGEPVADIDEVVARHLEINQRVDGAPIRLIVTVVGGADQPRAAVDRTLGALADLGVARLNLVGTPKSTSPRPARPIHPSVDVVLAAFPEVDRLVRKDLEAWRLEPPTASGIRRAPLGSTFPKRGVVAEHFFPKGKRGGAVFDGWISMPPDSSCDDRMRAWHVALDEARVSSAELANIAAGYWVYEVGTRGEREPSTAWFEVPLDPGSSVPGQTWGDVVQVQARAPSRSPDVMRDP
jgi:hypothetical protein